MAAVLAAFLASCGPRPSPPEPREFRLGFWYWRTPEAFAYQGPALDALYVQGGELDAKGRLSDLWPPELPPARRYVSVLRIQKPEVPKPALLRPIVEAYKSWAVSLRKSGAPLRGLQIDLDVPTTSLGDYAVFLEALRKALPPGTRLSITALVDWFRPGTKVRTVLEKVDEFVPQFYDVRPPGDLPRIAEAVSDRFSSRFEDAGKPYWIGAASFGRIERVRGSPPQRRAYREMSPLDLFAAPVRQTGVFTSPAGERILHFIVQRPSPRLELQPGDEVDVILPTRESIRKAVRSAREFGPNCQGVLFFRWPSRREALTLTPGEVLAAASERTPARTDELVVREGDCPGRRCYDLSVRAGDRLRLTPVSLIVSSSAPIDYLSPTNRLKVVFESRLRVRVEVPGDARESVIPIARAFSKEPATFSLTVEEK